MSSQGKKQEAFYIPSLDGLRAVSILIVFLSHAGLHGIIPGTFGVTVFFLLSGYLITTLLRQEWQKTGTVSLPQFYLRRVLRIFPPLYISIFLASAVCLAGIVPAALTWKAFFAQGFFLANYYEIYANAYGMPPSMVVLWSLAVEEHFYVFFPLIYIGLRRAKVTPAWQTVILLAVCAAVLVWRIALVYGLGVEVMDGTQGWHRMAHSTDTRLDGILAGCVLAVYGNPYVDGTRIPEAVWKYVLLPLGLGTLLFTFVYRSHEFRETFRYTVQALALIPVFVASVRYPDFWAIRPLNWSWVRRLGVLSYSFYLLHNVVIDVVNERVHAPNGVKMVLSFVLSFAASDLMYRLVEKPCAELRKRLSKGLRPAAEGVKGSPAT